MLTRAVRRQNALRYFQNAADQLQLPWLCPTLLRLPVQSSQTRPITSRHSTPSSTSAPNRSTPSRHLASAATRTENFESNDDYLPFSFGSQTHPTLSSDAPASSFQSSPQSKTSLEPLDIEKILMIDNTVALAPHAATRKAITGIAGDTNDIEATLEACLQVRRWDRAFAILRQLGNIGRTTPYEPVNAFNRTLDAMVSDLLWTRDEINVERITNWVEVDMKTAGVEPDAKTYALKIKAALATLSGSRRDRTVRRYWELAKKYNLEGQVAGLRHILTDSDLGKLSEICPLRYDFELDPESYQPLDTLEVTSDRNIARKAPIHISDTPQKGMGLMTLKQSLSMFSEDKHLEERENFGGDGEAYAEARQARLEHDAIESTLGRWRIEHEKMAKMGISGNLSHGRPGALLWQWHVLMTEKLCKELELVSKAEAKTTKNTQDRLRCEYGPFLHLLPPAHLAAVANIAIVQVMSKHGIESPVKVVRLVSELGRIVESEVQSQELRKHLATRRSKAKDMSTATPFSPSVHWSSAIRAKVGAVLCELLLDTAKINVAKNDPKTGKRLEVAQPVYTRQVVYRKGKKIGTIAMHQAMIDILVAEPVGDYIAKQLPMICKPRPWKGFYEGGFLESTKTVLRLKSRENTQKDYGEAAAARGDLDQLFAGLDVLGRTGWKINPDVFNVMVEAWNSGKEVANIAPLEKEFSDPPKPSDPNDWRARIDYYNARRAIENEKGGLHSVRCFQNFQMEIAKAFRDETFYLPHNIDFRGRAYPLPPYLNQMGADNCRGLLLFARGKPLGQDGLRWLKIHLSNVYGFDKASLTDRENFPMSHIEDILDSVNNPLEGKRWWLTADDPWQCLATCFELTKALESPDPSKFISHLPVHQDGSCNGLQHYAALGGDVAGAKQVNLEPGDKPADIYTGVAELVKAEIREDIAAGSSEMAKQLEGKITRKVVKQTVMTNVYGVTFLGAIRQVRKQLDDLWPELKEQKKSGIAATYIARKIFKTLGAMFQGAHDIQYWLGDCANRISMSLSPGQLQMIAEKEENGKATSKHSFEHLGIKSKSKKSSQMVDPNSFRSSVIWTTPLKLPVVQPYFVNKGQQIKTSLQEITLAQPTVADAVNRRKQLQAFPPNFIHSLDATHMILSALKADELGLSFSAVHDSFWTHAADVTTMSSLLRDAFIRMHSEDIVGRLAAEFKLRYKGHLYLAQLQPGTKTARQLAKYRKGLGVQRGKAGDQARKQTELLLEIKRQKLLHSDKPEERTQGREMVTAASVFEKCEGWKDLHHKDSLGQTAIGHIPENTSEAVINEALNAPLVKDDVDLLTTLGPAIADAENNDHHELDAEHDADVEDVDAKGDLAAKAQPEKGSRVSKKDLSPSTYWLWLPLTFREVPKRGSFDVRRTRESQYFFS